MPFESFLGLLKILCEMGNYKTAPFTVATKWAMARRLAQKTGAIPSAVATDVTACSAIIPIAEISRTPSASALLGALSRAGDHTHMRSARHLSMVVRNDVEMRVGYWVLIRSRGPTPMQRIALVAEMAETAFNGLDRRVRLLCSNSRDAFALRGMAE